MLRNQVFNQNNYANIAAANNIGNPKPAFSLSRTQLAFWTVIISSTFIYVVINFSSGTSIVIPNLPPVNLVLLGIAAGTSIVAKVIDNSQKDNAGNSISQQDLPSKGFLTDIISDENGISIHRLQNVIWTAIVGVIYIYYVIINSKIPDGTIINNDLLGLMGISAGTYLGLKTTENSGGSGSAIIAAISTVTPQPVTTPAPTVVSNNNQTDPTTSSPPKTTEKST
ncbi:hypothetical protein [Mucilaginibacter sp. L196]|uniref:hypothetical protein n=1 Tax=Mucilaginibacter sp. L196 TaxID=1641870 RepID=UPI00131A9B92|nr:hypothetical protein [Mucilaginibacter sp. L196]